MEILSAQLYWQISLRRLIVYHIVYCCVNLVLTDLVRISCQKNHDLKKSDLFYLNQFKKNVNQFICYRKHRFFNKNHIYFFKIKINLFYFLTMIKYCNKDRILVISILLFKKIITIFSILISHLFKRHIQQLTMYKTIEALDTPPPIFWILMTLER